MKWLVVILALLAGAPALGENCKSREEWLQSLGQQFGEETLFVGLAQGGRVIELLRAPGSGTWSLIVTDPSGRSCLLAAGRLGELFAPRPKGDPA